MKGSRGWGSNGRVEHGASSAGGRVSWEPPLQATRGKFYKFQYGEDPDMKVAQPFPQIWLQTVAAQPNARTPHLRTGTEVREAWLWGQAVALKGTGRHPNCPVDKNTSRTPTPFRMSGLPHFRRQTENTTQSPYKKRDCAGPHGAYVALHGDMLPAVQTSSFTARTKQVLLVHSTASGRGEGDFFFGTKQFCP